MTGNSESKKPINPNENLQIPAWINESYFDPIVANDVPNFKRIVRFTPLAATAPGENYASIMVRVEMDIELQDGSINNTSYILKTMLDLSKGNELISTMKLFPKEKKMYQTILPQFEKLYKDAGVEIQLGPKCLYVEELTERITMVFEDLRQQHFMNMNRLQGFDMGHMTEVLRKLAEMHAASAVYYELNGGYDEMFRISFFCEANRSIFEAMGDNRHVLYLKAMRKWNLEHVERYIARMPTPGDSFNEGIRLNQVDPSEFNVLNHGDCWVNNIMFSHNENGEIARTLFIDFQMSKWGTPAQDLWYMILTSASGDIKLKEFDQFIYIYHERLVECLRLLKYGKPILKLNTLHIMMLKYNFWARLTSMATMTAVLLPSDKDANMENMMKSGPDSDDFHLKMFTNVHYVRAMRQLLPFFEHKGFFDI